MICRTKSRNTGWHILSVLCIVALATAMLAQVALAQPSFAGELQPPIPQGGLAVWLTADKDVFSDTGCTTPAGADDNVGCWKDRSPNALAFTLQGAAPGGAVLETNWINHQAAVHFQDGKSWLETSGLPSNFPTKATTVWIVSRADTQEETTSILATRTSDTNRFNFHIPWQQNPPWGDNIFFDFGNAYGTGRVSAHVDNVDTFSVWGFRSESQGTPYMEIFRDCTPVDHGRTTTSDVFVPEANAKLLIADRYGHYTGRIAEIIVYNEALSEPNFNVVQDYLRSKYHGAGTGKCTPTAITLASFTGEGSGGQVSLNWRTGTETHNAGFNLLRAAGPDGPFVKVNPQLLAASGDATAGAAYSYVDRPGYGAFYYQLQDVDTNGTITAHGPVQVTVAAPWRRPAHQPAPPVR